MKVDTKNLSRDHEKATFCYIEIMRKRVMLRSRDNSVVIAAKQEKKYFNAWPLRASVLFLLPL